MMKKKLTTLLVVAVCVVMLAVCMPVSAFAEETAVKFKRDVYTLSFENWNDGNYTNVEVKQGMTITVPQLTEGSLYWCTPDMRHFTAGQQLTYEEVGQWLDNYVVNGTVSPMAGVAVREVRSEPIMVNYYDLNGFVVKSYAISVSAGNTAYAPTEINGRAVSAWYGVEDDGTHCEHSNNDYMNADWLYFWGLSFERHAFDFYPIYADGNQVPTLTEDVPSDVPAVEPVPTTQPAIVAATSDETPPAVDTRTAQQKEIDEAKANGTWGIEYTTCMKCGYHNWTRKGNVYVCDTCGNETTTVVGPKGVKGYVGSGAIALVAGKKAAPETRYATAKEAQAAADKREADYAAAVAAFQKQIAAQNAAYLAALGK